MFIRRRGYSKLSDYITFYLHPGRRFKIAVVFHPYAVRSFEGLIVFKTVYGEAVPLYGYGGNGFVNYTFADRSVDNVLAFHMSYTQEILTQFVECRNYGKLPAFVYADYKICQVVQFAVTLKLRGSDNVLEPRHKSLLFVNFTINDSVLKYFHKNPTKTVGIGALNLYTGSEILRYRLYRLVDHVEESDCRTLPLALVKKLTAAFSFEHACPEDVDGIWDPPYEIEQLLQAVSVQTIPLVVRPPQWLPTKQYTSFTFTFST